MSNISAKGLLLATATAALLMAGGIHTANAADAATVKCAGINSCKGTSECKSAANACKGQNSCKGMGWVSKATSEACTEASGKVIE
jgi:hypothetical protein